MRPDYKSIYSYFISFYKYSETVNPHYYSQKKKLCELDMIDARILTYDFSSGLLMKIKGSSKNYLKPFTKFECDK